MKDNVPADADVVDPTDWGLGSWAATSALVATILLIGYLPKEPPLFDELTARAQLRPFNPLAICDH